MIFSSSSSTLFIGTVLSVSYILHQRHVYKKYIEPYLVSSTSTSTSSSVSASSSSVAVAVHENTRAEIKNLYVYPVKGMRGHAVPRIEITPLGFLHDRRFVVVDIAPLETEEMKEKKMINSSSVAAAPLVGNFLTQRSHPRLATMTPYLYTKTMDNERLASSSVPYHFPTSSADGVLQYIRLTVDTEALKVPFSTTTTSVASSTSSSSGTSIISPSFFPSRPSVSIDIPIITANDILSLPASSLPAGVCFRPVQVWRSTIANCIDLGNQAEEYLQYYLNTNFLTGERIDKYAQLRLMYQDPAYHTHSSRKLSTKYIPSWLIQYIMGINTWSEYFSSLSLFTSFADGYPILLGNQVSLEDLNQRIQARVRKEGKERIGNTSTTTTTVRTIETTDDPFYGKEVSIHHFRPNIVVDHRQIKAIVSVATAGESSPSSASSSSFPSSSVLQAWEEDTWLKFNIVSSVASLEFYGIKRCDRCLVTTTDPFTGERGTGEPTEREPLATLSTYRSSRYGKKEGIFFAINILPVLNIQRYNRLEYAYRPFISIGDTIQVTKRGRMGPE